MSESRERRLLHEWNNLAVLVCGAVIVILGIAYFIIATSSNILDVAREFILGIILNLIPVLLIFIVSYALFRHIQTIRSEHETDELASKISVQVAHLLRGEPDVQREGETQRDAPIIVEEPSADSSKGVIYRAHVEKKGWMEWQSNGQVAGYKTHRMEAICIKLGDDVSPGMSVRYRVHVEGEGDPREWISSGDPAGTTGEYKRMEAICIELVNAPPGYSIVYRVYAQGKWMDWVSDGNFTSRVRSGKGLETICILISPGSADDL